MTSNPGVSARKRRRLLSPSQKYELYVSVLTGQHTQREAGQKYKIDRTTVTTICRTAKQGALDALSARLDHPEDLGGRWFWKGSTA